MSDPNDNRSEQAPAPAPRSEQPANPSNRVDEDKRLDPTRYGDWEKNGRCIDF